MWSLKGERRPTPIPKEVKNHMGAKGARRVRRPVGYLKNDRKVEATPPLVKTQKNIKKNCEHPAAVSGRNAPPKKEKCRSLGDGEHHEHHEGGQR